jgi:hypothetical protein
LEFLTNKEFQPSHKKEPPNPNNNQPKGILCPSPKTQGSFMGPGDSGGNKTMRPNQNTNVFVQTK